MEDYIEVINNSHLFAGVTEAETKSMLQCLSATTKEFVKKSYILRCGDLVSSVCLVLAGSVLLVKEDYWGNQNIVTRIQAGQIFAETYACVEGQPLGVSAVAAEKTRVLYLDVHRILSTCPTACAFHTRMIRNLMSILAYKNLIFNEKITHLSQRTTRSKLLSYLSAEAARCGSASFDIAFNRQQLADYLSVDRSAMSNELCKMRDEGLLWFARNHFELSGQ